MSVTQKQRNILGGAFSQEIMYNSQWKQKENGSLVGW